MEKGIIYIVTGTKKYKDECLYSATHAKKHNPGIPITLFTDNYRGDKKPFDQIIEITEQIHPLKLKTICLERTPYRNTLFLDSDTKVEGPLDELFNTLALHDFSIGKCPHIDFSVRPPRFLDFVHPIDYNTGVFLFKDTPSTKKFVKKWIELTTGESDHRMRPGHFCDQHYFNHLINTLEFDRQAGLKMKSFDSKVYNVRKPIFDHLTSSEKERVVIKHWHLLNLSAPLIMLRKVKSMLKSKLQLR